MSQIHLLRYAFLTFNSSALHYAKSMLPIADQIFLFPYDLIPSGKMTEMTNGSEYILYLHRKYWAKWGLINLFQIIIDWKYIVFTLCNQCESIVPSDVSINIS